MWGYTQRLTGDIIVPPFEELQTPQVGAELLELERELHIPVRFVTVQQGCVRLVDGAALHLTPGDQVDSVELLLRPRGSVWAGTHDVHLVPNLRIQHQTLTWTKSVCEIRQDVQRVKRYCSSFIAYIWAFQQDLKSSLFIIPSIQN